MKLLLIFIALNALNVIIQTVKSICTVKSGKTVAAIVNALAYGLYTVVIIYMTCDLSTWAKAVIVGACNLVCVWVVKFIEEKMKRAKLWKISAAVADEKIDLAISLLDEENLSYSILEIMNGKYQRFEIFSENYEQSAKAKKILEVVGAKYFVSESKTL